MLVSGAERVSRAESSSHIVNQQDEVVKVSDVGGGVHTLSLSRSPVQGVRGFFLLSFGFTSSTFFSREGADIYG